MAASPLPAARKFTRPQPGDTWERIASRELADTPVEEAVGMLQSWNFHVFMRPAMGMDDGGGAILPSDVIFLEAPLPES